MTTKSFAAHLGTFTGTLVVVARQIDWAEVAQIVLRGLQILIVLTLLAGRFTRRCWDAIPALSEQLGQWWAQVLAPTPKQPIPAVATPVAHPLATVAAELEQLTVKQLRSLTGTRRKLAKHQLVAMALAC